MSNHHSIPIRIISIIILLAFMLTQTVPGYALRQVEPAERFGNAIGEVKAALTAAGHEPLTSFGSGAGSAGEAVAAVAKGAGLGLSKEPSRSVQRSLQLMTEDILVANANYEPPAEFFDHSAWIKFISLTYRPSNRFSAHFTRGILISLLQHSSEDVKTTNDTAIEFSKKTKRPVLVVGVERTGAPYTCAIDNWWSQLKDPEGKERFYIEAGKISEVKKISEEKAEFIVAQEWLDKGEIDWYVSVVQSYLPSKPTLQELWGKGFDYVEYNEFSDEWVEDIENTTVNLMFVDETIERHHDNLTHDFESEERFNHPFSFRLIRRYILPRVEREGQPKKIYYINADEMCELESWLKPDAFSIVFYRPARRLPKGLLGRFPLRDNRGLREGVKIKNQAYGWWDNIDEILEIDYSQLEIVETNLWPMPLHIFVRLKLKELSGWFERNRIDLFLYAMQVRESVRQLVVANGQQAQVVDSTLGFGNGPSAPSEPADAKMSGLPAGALAKAGEAEVGILVLTDSEREAKQAMQEIIPDSLSGRVNVAYKVVANSLGELTGLKSDVRGYDRVVMYFTDAGLSNAVGANLAGIEFTDISDEAQKAALVRELGEWA